MRREMRLQFGKDPMLEWLFFGCRFDDQIHRAEARELRLRGDPGERRVARLLGDLAARNLAIHVRRDHTRRRAQRRLRHVVEVDIVPGERADMDDAVAHLAGADDANALDFHVFRSPALLPINHRQAPQAAQWLCPAKRLRRSIRGWTGL